MNRKIFIGLVSLFLFPVYSFGGGTVFDAEIDAILGQQPQIAGYVRSNMEFCKASWLAEIRLAGSYPLGGQRLGPYERRFRPTGSKANFDFILTINTTYKGFNNNGKEVDVTEATKIDEKMTSIDIRYDACKEDWCKAPQQGGAVDAATDGPRH